MKKILQVFILLILATTAHAQANFSIRGTITGAKENSEVKLVNDNVSQTPVATGKIKNQKFQLKGQLEQPAIYTLQISGVSQKLSIFMEPAKLQVSGKADSLAFATVNGSASHDDFLVFQQTFNPYFGRLEQLSKLLGNQQSGVNRDSVFTVARGVIEKLNTEADAFIGSHRQSAVSPLLLLILYNYFQQADVLDQRFASLDADARGSFYGKQVQEIVDGFKIGAVGTNAIDFAQADTSGQMVSLSSFRGKYVLVDFWASWCGPCRVENPNVVEAYQKYKDKNFTVLGVSLDRSREPWIKAIHDDKLTWSHVSDLKFWNNEVAQKYKIRSIPQNLLVDPDGKIIGKNLRGEDLQQKLAEILK